MGLASLWLLFGEDRLVSCLYYLLVCTSNWIKKKTMLKNERERKKRQDERTIAISFSREKKKEFICIINKKKIVRERERIEGCLYDDFLTALGESFCNAREREIKSTIKKRKRLGISETSFLLTLRCFDCFVFVSFSVL